MTDSPTTDKPASAVASASASALQSLSTDNIYSRLLNCALASGAIVKSGHFRQGQQNWHFHQIDEVVDHMRPILAQHGVIYMPSVVDATYETIVTEENNRHRVQRLCTTMIEVSFVNVDNPDDRCVIRAPGDGLDYGDKAPGKAFSYALKTALLAAFQLRGQPDNETDGVEQAAPAKQDARKQDASKSDKVSKAPVLPWEHPDLTELEDQFNPGWETMPCHISKKQLKPLLGDMDEKDLHYACHKWALPANPTEADRKLRAALNVARRERFPNG